MAERPHRNELTTLVSIVLIDGAYSFAIPTLPDYLIQLGVTGSSAVAFWTGLLMGVSPLLAAFAGPVWGRVGDRYGLRLMALRSTLALVVMYVASALVTGPQMFLLVRILFGFIGGYQTLVIALATQGGSQRRMGRIIARVQMLQITMAAASPALGGLLAHAISIRAAFWIAAAMSLLATAAFLVFYRDVDPPGREPPTESLFRVRPATGVATLAVLLFLVSMVDRSLQPATSLFAAGQARTPGESAHIAGLLLSAGALGDGLAAWVCGRVRGNSLRWMPLRAAGGMVTAVAMALADSVSSFFLARVAYAAAAGGMQTLLFMAAQRVIPPELRSSQFALLASCGLLGMAAGTMLAGAASSVRAGSVFWLNALLCACLLALSRAAARRRTGTPSSM